MDNLNAEIKATIIQNMNKPPLSLSGNDLGVSLGMVVFKVGAGLVLYTLGSHTVPAAELTLLSLAEVLLGPLFGVADYWRNDTVGCDHR